MMHGFKFLRILMVFFMAYLLVIPSSYAAQTMTVRGGDHDGYSRLVFDWPTAPPHVVENKNGTLTITFQGAGQISGNIPSNLRNIQNIESISGADIIGFSMAIAPDSKTRNFAVGNKIILDVYDGKNTIKKVTPTPAADVKKEEKPAVKQDFSVKEIEKTAAIPVQDVDVEPIGAPKIEPHIISLTTVTSVGLAVFVRHGDLWIVTDAPDMSTPPKLDGPQADKFNAFEKTDLPTGDLYRLELPDGVKPYVEGGGLSWKIYLTQTPPKDAGAKITPFERLVEDGRDKILWPIKGFRKIIEFTDPFAGDTVTAITANSANQTTGRTQEFVDFVALNTMAGFAFVAKADDVSAKLLADGAVIDSKTGLSLLNEKDWKPEKMRHDMAATNKEVLQDDLKDENNLTLTEKPPSADDIAALNNDEIKPLDTADMTKAAKQKPIGNNIYNFPKWELGGIKSLTSNMHALMAQVSAKNDLDKTEDVITMAKLLLANNRGPEALGMLRIAVSQVPELEDTAEYQSLRGAAYALSGKFDEAIATLSSDKLKNYDDIKLWRAYTLAGLEDWKQAGDLTPKDPSFLKEYPLQIKIPAVLVFAEIVLRNGREKEADEILKMISSDTKNLSLSHQSALDYLSGEARRQSGDLKKADEYWMPLVKNGKDDLYRAKAGLSLTRLQLDNKTIKPSDAIDRLEGLRYAWRGDELETLINYRLGQLYIDNKEYLKGLTVLRNAVTITPDLDIAKDVKKFMDKSFQDVFDKDKLAAMTPIEAISFYEEFKDLTPSSDQGNDYIEKLAERLVDAELLGRASVLLENLVNNRLQGDKKTEIAIRLAAIRLLDGNPDGALRSLEIAQANLDKSEQKDAEKQRQIFLLKARALSMKDKPDEALTILENLRIDPDVNKLRTDIAWVAGKWDQAAIALNDLITSEDISARTKLNDYQRDIILNRAIALNLSGERVALSNLRDRYNVQMKETSKGQMFEIVTRPRRPDLIGSREAIESMMSEIDLFKGFLDGFAKTEKKSAPPIENKTSEPETNTQN